MEKELQNSQKEAAEEEEYQDDEEQDDNEPDPSNKHRKDNVQINISREMALDLEKNKLQSPNNINSNYNNLLKKYNILGKEVDPSVIKPINKFNFESNFENDFKKFNKVKEKVKDTNRPSYRENKGKDDWYNQIFKEAFSKKISNNNNINVINNIVQNNNININNNNFIENIVGNNIQQFENQNLSPQNIISKKISELLESKQLKNSNSNLVNINLNNLNNYGQINAVTNISQVINIHPQSNNLYNDLVESISGNKLNGGSSGIKNKVNEVYKELNRVPDTEIWNSKEKFKDKYLNMQKIKKRNEEKNYYTKDTNQDYFLEIFSNAQSKGNNKKFGKNEAFNVFNEKMKKFTNKSNKVVINPLVNVQRSASSLVCNEEKDNFFNFNVPNPKRIINNNLIHPSTNINLERLKKYSKIVKEDKQPNLDRLKMKEKFGMNNFRMNFDKILTPNNLDKSSSLSSFGRISSNRRNVGGVDDEKNWSDFEILLEKDNFIGGNHNDKY